MAVRRRRRPCGGCSADVRLVLSVALFAGTGGAFWAQYELAVGPGHQVHTSLRRPGGPSGCQRLYEREDGVERLFERSGVPVQLGQQQPALQGGQQRDSECVRIGVRREPALGVHRP